MNHLWVVALDPTRDDTAVTNGAPGGGGGRERQVTVGTGESFGRFSPDGQFVSFTGAPTKDDPVARITIATWDEATGTIGVGRTLKAVSGDADGAIWSPDSKHFLFTTAVYPECSDKPTWAEEDACDAAKDAAAEKSPVKGEVWDALLYRHWDHYTGVKWSHIIEADFSLAGANPRDLTPASAVGDAETPTWFLGAPLQYAWAPDSKEIAYVTNLDPVPAASTNNDVFTLRLDEPGAKAVKVSTSPGSDDAPAYSPDGKWLAFRSQKQAGFESDRFRLMLYDRAAKKTNEVELTMKDYTSPGRPKESDLDRWVDEFTWVDDSKHILFVAGDHGEEPIYETNISGDDLHRYGKAAGEWSEIKEVLSNGRVAIVGSLMRVDRPTSVAIADPLQIDDSARTFTVALDRSAPTVETTKPTYEPRMLTHVNEALLSELDIPAMESFWFAGADGTEVQGFILRPPGFDAAKKYPVKFVMHGGPQTALGDSWSYRWNWELLAASGYVVIGINRRGSTGYGQKFVDEVSGDWGGRAYEDLMKGLDYAEAHYSLYRQDPGVRARGELWRVHGRLGADPYQPLQVHCDPRWHVGPGERVWDDRGDVVQRVGVP